MFNAYGYVINDDSISSFVNNLNLNFVTEKINNKLKPVGQVNGFNIVLLDEVGIMFHQDFIEYLSNEAFEKFLIYSVDYCIHVYNHDFNQWDCFGGFHLYRKHSRKDVFRILNWVEKSCRQECRGYIISKDKTNRPIFVNYHKEDDISDTTKYEDGFINEFEFLWMSKSKRKLDSPGVKAIRDYRNGLRLSLLIKKSNDEGSEFYCMGDVTPKDNGFEQTVMPAGEGRLVSVVKVMFEMNVPVKYDMYQYLLTN